MPTYKFKPEDIDPLLEGLAIYGTGGSSPSPTAGDYSRRGGQS
jgi:hypothetical protein